MQTFTKALKTIDASITSIGIEAWPREDGKLYGVICHRTNEDATAGERSHVLAGFIADGDEAHDDMTGRLLQAGWLPEEWVYYGLGGDEGSSIAATR